MQFQGLPGFAAASLGQQALQPIQIVGPNGQIQTVAILGGAALGLQQAEQVRVGLSRLSVQRMSILSSLSTYPMKANSTVEGEIPLLLFNLSLIP